MGDLVKKFIKKYSSYIILLLSVILIISQKVIEHYSVIDMYYDLESEIDDKFVSTMYRHLFNFAEDPVIQGVSFALIFICMFYAISIIYFGIARFCKVKMTLITVLETYLQSYSVIILKKIVDIIYYLIIGAFINNAWFNFIFATLQILIFTYLINKKVSGDKVNRIIYSIIIIVLSLNVQVLILIARHFIK